MYMFRCIYCYIFQPVCLCICNSYMFTLFIFLQSQIPCCVCEVKLICAHENHSVIGEGLQIHSITHPTDFLFTCIFLYPVEEEMSWFRPNKQPVLCGHRNSKSVTVQMRLSDILQPSNTKLAGKSFLSVVRHLIMDKWDT